jgi:alpha-galactosidase
MPSNGRQVLDLFALSPGAIQANNPQYTRQQDNVSQNLQAMESVTTQSQSLPGERRMRLAYTGSGLKVLKLFLLGALVSSSYGQGISGKWVADWRVLDNGEIDRLSLDLHQDSTQINGTAATIGHMYQVDGASTGDHFKLALSKGGSNRTVEGVVEGTRLRLEFENAEMVAFPAKPGDEYPALEQIPAPALKDLLSNGLAMTPPMGWNSWNAFENRIDDKMVREMADEIVKNGMRDAGYVYINIDDTWEGVRDAQGNITANKKFPDMKALADYVHSKGLKFGIYSSPGPRTCGEYPGSYGHEEQDAKTFAAWGVDFLKYDWCGARMVYKDSDLRAVYQRMGDALLSSGRAVVYSLCEYGNGHVETWGTKVGANLWRTTGDIHDTWSSMIGNITKQIPTAASAGPGHWNDPDMLEVGNGHMTDDEYRTHMSLWALTSAPLLAGNDIRTMAPSTKEILLNLEVIAVDQDTLGMQATPIKHGIFDLWTKPLADGSVAVGVVNLGATETTVSLKASDLGLGTAVRSARDLWKHADVAFHSGVYETKVPSHGVLMLRVSGKRLM